MSKKHQIVRKGVKLIYMSLAKIPNLGSVLFQTPEPLCTAGIDLDKSITYIQMLNKKGRIVANITNAKLPQEEDGFLVVVANSYHHNAQ